LALFPAFPYISKIHLCCNKDHQENVLQPVRKKRAKLFNEQRKGLVKDWYWQIHRKTKKELE
jgi:hypothetical protein